MRQIKSPEDERERESTDSWFWLSLLVAAETKKILRRGAGAEARAPPPRHRSTHDVCKQYPVLAAAAMDGSRK
jgi:hypothetical protein